MHSYLSAVDQGTVISRSFLEENQQLLSLFVEDCNTTAFGLVGTTAFGLIQQKRSFDKPADALLGVSCLTVDRKVIELLSASHISILEELTTTARAHGLIWKKPCCSNIFEGSPRDRGAVIARNNTNTRSSCWIRTMIMVDGVWTVEPCADKWVKIPRKVFSTEVPRQRQYDDTLPTMSIFFKLLRKRWADVCVEVVEFGASPRLLPIGSTQFCRSLQLAEPVSSFASSSPTVFALKFSQFCSVFIDLSLFSWLPSTDISEFLSSIALDRTILCILQRSQDSFAVAPSVQLSLEQHQSSSSSSHSSSSLHFDQTDIDATAMHKIEKSVCDSLREQADIFKNLSQGARQEVRTIDDVHTIRFNEFRKNVLTQNATIFQGLADVRQVVDAVNAKVDIMAKRRFDKLERRRGMHSYLSAVDQGTVISRSFLEENQQLLSLFVEDCNTTAFGLVGTTAFGLIQQKRSFDKPADALLGVNQQMYFKDSKTASLE
ncbi:cation/H(+) antiporter 4 [Dorcoceras hygrometricum]|uniref:Cation/H(+) antiporter 4 n=1 Tax=Dorcoceras hygrometricum TaxID=472368 RepID=A0A2Z7AFE7_9LAMI|nr:cation/H(+) antiporter 4 [Dorcoceras hygrometricum]